jgi:hypothetical protein
VVNELPWIDASKAHLLQLCFLRWSGDSTAMSGSGWRKQEDHWTSATLGSQAHKALEQWATSSEWLSGSPGALLRARFLAITEANQRGLGARRIMATNLAVRGRELALRFKELGCKEVWAERSITDGERRIRGQLDLVARSADAVHIFDLKTGRGYVRNQLLPLAARTQLACYSALASKEWQLPTTASILSLGTGILDSDINVDDAERVVSSLVELRVAAARESPPEASPSAEACGWCMNRPACEPHWGAVASGRINDALMGTLERSDLSANGQASLVLDTDSGRQLATGLSNYSEISPGATVAVVRINRSEDAPNIWHANANSAVAVLDDTSTG